MLLDVLENLDDRVDIVIGEDGVGATLIGVGRLEEPTRVHDAVRGQLVDDQLDEAHLVHRERGVVEIVAECVLGGGAVEADQ